MGASHCEELLMSQHRSSGFRQRASWSVAVLAALASLLSPSPSRADVLRDPPGLQSPGSALTVQLSAKNGTVHINGAGAVNDLFLLKSAAFPLSLTPPTLRMRQGQTLLMNLTNHLDCKNSADNMPYHRVNLHTHGLLVSPHEKQNGRYGDFMYAQAESDQSCAASPGEHGAPGEPGAINYSIEIPPSHPSGLFWYHPHIHGSAGAHVGGGMSGLITVGRLWDYAYIGCALDAAEGTGQLCKSKAARAKERERRNRTDQHLLMLKDIQVSSNPTGGWTYSPTFDPGFCDTDTGPHPAGFCTNTTNGGRWLFTLNGQLLPTIHIGRNRGNVWRLANTSATVTYRLRLVIDDGGTKRPIPLQLIAMDGVALASTASSHHTRQEILLMPASRAEVYVDGHSVCRVLYNKRNCSFPTMTATLETMGFKTGSTADTWPQVDLAKVVIRGASIDTPERLFIRPHAGHAQAAAEAKKAPPAAAPPTTARAAAACSGANAPAPTTLQPDQYRLIGLKNEKSGSSEYFHMLTEGPRPLSDSPSAYTPTLATDYKSFDATRTDLCIGAPIASGTYEETWVVINEATEIHNFHIHQAKFEVLETSPDSPNTPAIPPTGTGVYHDTFPVAQGGWIKLRIRFNRPEQVGKYMYHCHILEHEDRGMMSVIEVLDTSPTS